MSEQRREGPRLSLSTSILIGLVAGVLCGVFFGEYCAFLKISQSF